MKSQIIKHSTPKVLARTFERGSYKKRCTCLCVIVLLVTAMLTNNKLSAQKNYVSIETGGFFGGPANSLANQMTASGFGAQVTTDFNLFNLDLLFGSSTISYPMIINTKTKYWLRFGRELKNNRSIEAGIGLIHNSMVSGFSEDIQTTDANNFLTGNGLTFENRVHAFTFNYIFNTKKHNAGIGAGPAIAFYKLTRSWGISGSSSFIQPGISTTAFWRFINGKIFFMALRADALLLVPHKIAGISVINDFGYKSTFPATAANTLNGDVTISIGFKF